jgi:ABC-type nitrate/sulfonate/bicarbonate transport system substrate-binding protein
MHLGRRQVLSASVAAALFPPAVHAAGTAVTILTPFGFIIDFLEVLNAKAGGHFAAAGLDATVLGAGGAAASIQQLAAGRCQFTRGAAIDAMRAVSAQKLDLVSIATLFQGSTFVVISAAAKPIRTAEDLRGKRMGVVSIGGSTENFLDLMLIKAAIPKAETPREVVGNNPGAFALIQQGRIDGFIASSNVASVLVKNGAPVEVFSTDKYAPMPSQIYLTTRRIIETQPEQCQAFVRALKASVDEIIAGPIEPLIERASKEFEIPGIRDRAALVQTIVEDIPLWMSQGKQNLMRNVPALWRSCRDNLAAAGLADIPDETKLYTNAFVDKLT